MSLHSDLLWPQCQWHWWYFLVRLHALGRKKLGKKLMIQTYVKLSTTRVLHRKHLCESNQMFILFQLFYPNIS